ncbi:hypothetical protein FG167_16055 [Lacinutrix sp. WUR7]|uniref:hypothetical protein n=1 Tax=Lacinutrix sp. WUR7 TaxID=2653681 RepID=UPI00193E6882|nr:hypothetical protein [Lacinutrix sp. WUR7]QRM90685.1 hypothetical protein FG167_16055 [Lacinutrix sp. WUR7]
MKLIDSKFAPSVEGINVTRFGVIYFFKDFVVTEINEGVVYGTETSEELTRLILEQYATKTNIHVISNRINNYSVEPTYWFDFYKNEHADALKSVSFVYYNELAYSNAKLEQTFINCKTECFKSLQEAINNFSKITNKRTA